MPGVIAEGEVTCGTSVHFNINMLHVLSREHILFMKCHLSSLKEFETVDHYHRTKAERQVTSEYTECDE